MISAIEETLWFQLRVSGFPMPEREYRFDSSRRWRFDFCYPARKLAIECEGGLYSGGRHTRPTGYENDLAKYNTACLQGWKVLRFSRSMVENGSALQAIGLCLGLEPAESNAHSLET